jgi:hypothetical protein
LKIKFKKEKIIKISIAYLTKTKKLFFKVKGDTRFGFGLFNKQYLKKIFNSNNKSISIFLNVGKLLKYSNKNNKKENIIEKFNKINIKKNDIVGFKVNSKMDIKIYHNGNKIYVLKNSFENDYFPSIFPNLHSIKKYNDISDFKFEICEN